MCLRRRAAASKCSQRFVLSSRDDTLEVKHHFSSGLSNFPGAIFDGANKKLVPAIAKIPSHHLDALLHCEPPKIADTSRKTFLKKSHCPFFEKVKTMKLKKITHYIFFRNGVFQFCIIWGNFLKHVLRLVSAILGVLESTSPYSLSPYTLEMSCIQ